MIGRLIVFLALLNAFSKYDDDESSFENRFAVYLLVTCNLHMVIYYFNFQNTNIVGTFDCISNIDFWWLPKISALKYGNLSPIHKSILEYCKI